MRGNGSNNIASWGIAAAALALGYHALRQLRRDDLDGEVAFITGGSRGLGLALARGFILQGCSVAICARGEAELGRARAWLRRETGAEVLTLVADVREEADVRRAVREATAFFGGIDILVNNAGIIQVGPVTTATREDFERCMDTMFWGPYNCTMAVLPQMRERGFGRIVNITSIGGLVSVPHLLPYSCAKFAAVGLSEGLRGELARDGIHVTTVAPGLIRNGSFLHAEFKGEDAEKEYHLFSPFSSLPPMSMDVERTAHQILDSVRRRESMRVTTLMATLLSRFHGLLPGTTAAIMGLVNAMLPWGESTRTLTGRELHEQTNSRLYDMLTAPGQRRAREYNEV